jgi:3-hydroxyisobutyrate dehydrogenase-like beta-hydroxyacid dehydrogenase
MDDEALQAADPKRHSILGDEHVDAVTSEDDGVHEGLDMAIMLEVLNGSSGRTAATSDKFPNHVLTGRYASGFSNSLMAKDTQLSLQAVADRGAPSTVGAITTAVWDAFAADSPGADFTRIYPFVTQEER